MNELPEDIKLVIPEELVDKYNGSLSELKRGENTLVGNREQLEMLEVAMLDPDMPNCMILGEQGIGKTALVEQFLYDRFISRRPMLIVSLSIEALGELPENLMVSRMRTLLQDMNLIKQETEKENGITNFDLCLFIDEVHKLSRYGFTNGSSGAMNALKESTARGEFPLITATTDYEYRKHIASDLAFDRRFTKIILTEPNKRTVKKILKRRVEKWKETNKFEGSIQEGFFDELISLSDSFIRNQVNPAKSLSILSSCVGYARNQKIKTGEKQSLGHSVLKFVFKGEGYNIESEVTASEVERIVEARIRGQPIARMYIKDLINASFYTKRDFKKPMMSALLIGTTGTGKTETAKALATALFGREDAMVVVNGGDYSNSDDVHAAQNFIGDSVAVNKQLVILLDEIEKSHPNVLNSYLRMIDEGIVRDSLGIERSINNTVLLATSNLGAKTFSDLAETMKINTIENPNEISEELLYEWYKQESAVRESLQNGDEGKNNGIRPEFLERFQLFIPYFPLPRQIIAEIARKKLEQFRDEMRSIGYVIQLPSIENAAYWEKYGVRLKDVDSISVMIAEDLINRKGSTTGARAINRFIDNSIKTKVANAIADRVARNLSMEGAFQIKTNGNASFESQDRNRPDVSVVFVGKGE
ncbi:TPA: AAA family ATPase [Enterococcus faecium]